MNMRQENKMTYNFQKNLKEIKHLERRIATTKKHMDYLLNVNNPSLRHMKMNFIEELIFGYFWNQCYYGLLQKFDNLKSELQTRKMIYNHKGLTSNDDSFTFLHY